MTRYQVFKWRHSFSLSNLWMEAILPYLNLFRQEDVQCKMQICIDIPDDLSSFLFVLNIKTRLFPTAVKEYTEKVSNSWVLKRTQWTMSGNVTKYPKNTSASSKMRPFFLCNWRFNANARTFVNKNSLSDSNQAMVCMTN